MTHFMFWCGTFISRDLYWHTFACDLYTSDDGLILEDAYGKGWFRFGLLHHDVKLKFERQWGRNIFELGLGDNS